MFVLQSWGSSDAYDCAGRVVDQLASPTGELPLAWANRSAAPGSCAGKITRSGIRAQLVDHRGGLAQTTPAPDTWDATVLEHVYVVGEIADHEQRTMPDLTHEKRHGAGRVSRGREQYQAAITEQVVAASKG